MFTDERQKTAKKLFKETKSNLLRDHPNFDKEPSAAMFFDVVAEAILEEDDDMLFICKEIANNVKDIDIKYHDVYDSLLYNTIPIRRGADPQARCEMLVNDISDMSKNIPTSLEYKLCPDVYSRMKKIKKYEL